MSPEYLWFLFYEGKILLRNKEKPALPYGVEPPVPPSGAVLDVGDIGGSGIACRTCAVSGDIPDMDSWLTVGLRETYTLLSEEEFTLAGKAAQLNYWDVNSQYCPACGCKTGMSPDVPAKLCPACGKLMFPQITPAVLVLVEKDESILLVRAHNFIGPFYGLVAGFLEAGESLEDCARREIMEETGISIKNIRYFASGPWAFPSNIMIGFTADYDAGEILLQKEELADAAFYTRDNIPELPHKMSLTRSMIDWWVAGKKSWNSNKTDEACL